MKKLLLIIAITCFTGISFSQNTILKEASAAVAGVSAERLTRIDKVLQEYIDKQWIAGGAAIIAKDGKIIYYKAIGYNDINKKKSA